MVSLARLMNERVSMTLTRAEWGRVVLLSDMGCKRLAEDVAAGNFEVPGKTGAEIVTIAASLFMAHSKLVELSQADLAAVIDIGEGVEFEELRRDPGFREAADAIGNYLNGKKGGPS